jgi:DNA-binding transcriptional LysR family regulator
MSITFRRLQVFVAAARDGNFRRTAERLGISEPSVSAQIHALENHLGYLLFDRRRGATSTLSEEGVLFLARARDLLSAEEELAAGRNEPAPIEPAILKLSVGPILLEARFKPALPEFHERHPAISLEFVPFNSTDVSERAIRTGVIDGLLYTGGPPPQTRSHTEILTRVSCSVYGPASVDVKATRLPGSLADLPFIMPPRHYPLSKWFEAQLASIGQRPRNVVARPPYMEVARQMIMAGQGLAVLFDEHAADYVESGQLKRIRSMPVAAYRVMMLGRRALQPQVSPALAFLRRVACTPTASRPRVQHAGVQLAGA